MVNFVSVFIRLFDTKRQFCIAELALRVQIRTIWEITRVVSIWFVISVVNLLKERKKVKHQSTIVIILHISVVHLWKEWVIARKNEKSINNFMILNLWHWIINNQAKDRLKLTTGVCEILTLPPSCDRNSTISFVLRASGS